MVKIFIGNIASDASPHELRELFEKYGQVSQCDILKNYGFVHMDNMSEAEEAIKNLHQQEMNGWRMNVELSKGRPKSTTKLHVSNLSDDVTREDLRAKFEEFGPVAECDIVKDYAFVHMEQVEDAMNAISSMDNTAFKGKLLSVQLSTSRHRTAPGMGGHSGCFVCGKQGHWSKDCLAARSDRGGARGRSDRGFHRGGHPGFGMGSPPMPDYMGTDSMYNRSSYASTMPPLPARGPGTYEQSDMYGSRPAERSSAYDRYLPYSSADYYNPYAGQAYGTSYFEDRRVPYAPPPPPTPPVVSSYPSTDTYDRRSTVPASTGYYARETDARSGYDRSRLSPVSGRAQAQPAKDPYTQRYAPY